MNDGTQSVSESLGQWAAAWPGDAAPAAYERARLAVYDTIACMIAGSREETAAAVRKTVAALGGGEATVVGLQRGASAPWAALANGTAAHALDYDDGSEFGPTHISAVLVPALLALAEETGASGRRVLEAYLVGTEILAQIGRGLARAHYLKGWHPTSTIGAIAAAAACGRLLRLDAEAMTNAIGLGASMAAGMKAQFGSMAKPFHAGMAAKNGVLAAMLASNGLTASRDAIDGRLGFKNLYGGEASPGWSAPPRPTSRLGIEEHGIGAKFYPCCFGAHRTLDGVLELRAQHAVAPNDVASVETKVAASSAQNLMRPSPQNEIEARFSMNYCVAVALLSGRLGLSDFTPEAVARPEVRKLLPLIHMEGMAPSQGDESAKTRAPALVRITLKDGSVYETHVQDPIGAPAKPMDAAQMSEKFRDCANGSLSPQDVVAMETALQAFADARTVHDLLRPLRHRVADHADLQSSQRETV